VDEWKEGEMARWMSGWMARQVKVDRWLDGWVHIRLDGRVETSNGGRLSG